MSVRFTAIAGLAFAFAFAAFAAQDSNAANFSPVQIGKVQSSKIATPAHCRRYRHCHRRLYRGRYIRVCHRC